MAMKTNAEENDHPDHLGLKQLLNEARPAMHELFPGQQKVWVAERPLAQQIHSIPVRHPEYFAEVRAAVGDPIWGSPVEGGQSHE
jgi:hypothetical protein